jgi:dTDP-4-amino-4,6-dideoxygalactose transaminase
MLLYWSLIREAIARGTRAFNFGRCTPGAPTHRFKQQWGADGAVLCDSGTHALTLAASLARRRRREGALLLPAYTWYDVATAAVGARLPVSLYDLDPESLQPDWGSLLDAGRYGAVAVVVAPLHGVPIDWDAARAAADERNDC